MNESETLYEEIAPLKGHDGAYLVLHQQTGRIYVRKCLEIYQAEVYRQLAGVQNIHIPVIYDCEESSGRLHIIEEYINGQTLMERITSGALFSEQETLGIILQICDALACLHDLEPPVIHRDIKLSNVMITNDGIVKLIDYNAARHYTIGTEQDTTFLGTADYAAPEQFGFSQTDARTDIYALGVLMNYMLTGKSCKTSLYSGFGNIRRVIRRCTCMDPGKRYQTALDLKHALQRCQRSNPTLPQTALCRFWPLPGFRTGKLWKMMTASFGYLLLFLVCAGTEIESHKSMPFITLLDRIATGLWSLFIIALFCDYADVREQFPFLSHPHGLVRFFGIVLFSFLGMLLAIIIPEIFALLIYG